MKARRYWLDPGVEAPAATPGAVAATGGIVVAR
jgi:hypothetical protein